MLLFILLLCFSSCTPKEEAPGQSAGQTPLEQDPESGTSLTLSRTSTDKKESGPGGKEQGTENESDSQQQKAGEVIQWAPFSGPLHLQSIKPAAYILPESLMIGTLADPLSYTESERQACYLVNRFWTVFRSGRIPRELISSSAHPLFLQEMEAYVENGGLIRDFYPGSYSLLGKGASIKVVLLSETGYIRGQMYLKNENNSWRFDDWEFSFRDWPGEAVPREKDLLQSKTVY